MVQDSRGPLTVKRFFRLRQILLLVLSLCIVVISPYLQQELVKAQSALPTKIATGKLWQEASFPVENFEAYSSTFGPRGGDFHYGLDMAAPEGSYIRNWWGGQVVEVWEDGRCGTGMVVRSGDWEHIYCHLGGKVEKVNGGRYYVDREGSMKIWQGQTVPAGARIARVGMTGRTTGPHLHWGLKYGGRWVDPALVLREMYSNQS
ncbi:M23 family metallopeptidase [Microcoleus sp. S36a_D3]|uniref:M23 family metallopeptidase n=1 Tax=unclassified Microcoleus TaxID=2642155 RepID=UPI003FA523E5